MPDTNKLLYVDDDPLALAGISRHLRMSGFEVLTAANGLEAIEVIKKRDPSIVITDWEMPEMDGPALCKEIRALETTSFTYIIMLTAHDKIENIVDAFEYGANDFIAKPCDPRALLARAQAGQRIIAMEAANQKQALTSRKLHAELTVSNVSLQRMACQLDLARKEAEAAAQTKSDFLTNMSHEIRTPMTAILGFADNLLDPTLSDTERRNAIYTIRRNGEFLLDIINDILDFSKIEAGRLEVENVRSSPVQLTGDVQSLLQVRAKEKGLVFEVDYDGPIPETIETDPTRFRQILINLAGNAIKFTAAGSVRIVCRYVADGADSQMQFDVIDTGIGMTEEQASRLFQPFTQADPSTTRRFGGTGLGLVISKRLVEMMGGKIEIVDTQPSKGTHFRATIPTGSLNGVQMLDNPEADSESPAIQRPILEPGTTLDCRVLLAEDGPDNQRLIQHILTKSGAEVTMVDNGQLAVEAVLASRAEGREFDIILMDMQMPVMGGYEASALLRKEGYDGPIIALTAHAMQGARKKCLNAGCDDYVTKPLDRKKLVDVITAWLRPEVASV